MASIYDTASAAAPPSAVDFDVSGARKAGYSDADIADYLGQQSNFDAPAARKAGYDDGAIIRELTQARAPEPEAAKEKKPEESWLGVAGKAAENLPSEMEAGVGRAMTGVASMLQDATKTDYARHKAEGQVTPEDQAQEVAIEKGLATRKAQGQDMSREAESDIADNAPNIEPRSAKDYAYRAALGLADLLPAVAAAVITKQPEAGAYVFAGQAGTEKYGEARGEGRSQTQASLDAGFSAIMNGTLAELPLGALMKPGGTFLKKTLQTAGAGAFQSAATTALQEGYDAGIVHKDMPVGEAVRNVLDAGIVGGLTGAALGAGAHGVERLAPRLPQPEPAPEAPPPPPAPSTPEQSAAPVLAAGSVDEAISAAQTTLDREPIDIEAESARARATAEAVKLPENLHPVIPEAEPEAHIEVSPAAGEPEKPSTPEAIEEPQETSETSPETPSLVDSTELAGRVRGTPRRVTSGPVDAATFLAMNGGIRNDEGHDLAMGRGLQQFVPGVGPLIRPGGMSIDAAGEILHEQGFFGPPESTPRPSENEVLQLLERTRRDDQGRPSKVYTPDDQARLARAEEDKHAEIDNTRILQDIHDEAHANGETLSEDEAHQVAANMGEHGLNPAAAVGEYLEHKYARLVEEAHEQTRDDAYAEAHPDRAGEGAVDLGAGEGVEGSAPVAEGARPGGEGRDHAAPVASEGRELTAERGAAGLDQTVIPGAEQSAQQLADAREAQGHGRIRANAPQAEAGGMFAPKLEETQDMFFNKEHPVPLPADKDVLFQRQEPVFYSALTRAVEGLKMDKAAPGQWEATLKNQPGVKSEELEWSGLTDWLRQQTKHVTKADVLQHLRENEVHVQEIEKSQPTHAQREDAHLIYDTPRGQTKYHQYALPGGKNYRELLLTLPSGTAESRAIGNEAAAYAKKLREKYGENWSGRMNIIEGARYSDLINRQAEIEGPTFKSGHWDEPNILAHVRFDDRTGPNGEKVLHIAEAQSDWHQAGRRKGYNTPVQTEAVHTGDPNNPFNGAEIITRQAGVPDAPFKSSWHELAMKRVLRYAAEHGYDRVSWDTGETQAERYSLQKHIGRVVYNPETLLLEAFRPTDKLERDPIIDRKVLPKDLADHVGKEVSDKLLASPTGKDGRKVLENADLKIGGEGMKGFYDKILPAFLNRYGKKWGAKVEPSIVGKGGEPDQEYRGPVPTSEQIKEVQNAVRAKGQVWDSPITGERQMFVINRVANLEIDRVANAMAQGESFSEAMRNYGSPAIARIFGGDMVETKTAMTGAQVHSIPITTAMRESVMAGQPMFAKKGGVTPLPPSAVKGHYSAEFEARRAEVAEAMRQRLDEMNLHDIAVKVADAITAGDDHVNGAYARKIIALSLESDDLSGTLDHEAVHALRSLGLFKKTEWSILAQKAIREWRNRYDIDKRYADFDEDRRNEEAIAEAFRYWRKGSGDQKGTIARIFDKVRNTLAAIGNGLRGLGFVSADDIFRKVSTGEVGARDNGGNATAVTLFQRRPPPTEDEIYRDGVQDLIQSAQSNETGANTGARLLDRIARKGIQQIKNPNVLETGGESGYIGTLFPRTMASLDDMSARLWRAWSARDEQGHANVERLRAIIGKSLTNLSPESRDRVYAALELARKFDWRPPDDGRAIRVKNTSYWQAQKSKVGDNYVLSPAETRAFHDALKLGDEGWKTFMNALARREGWRGPIDPQAIRDAANKGNAGLPEGRRLLRLADVIEAGQSAMNRPYFPAMRFGDYFIAVKPKVGSDEMATGGYPHVAWFETVEKSALDDVIGRRRLKPDDMPAVQEALTRLKAKTKPDGSLAFPEDKYDIEIGDLKSRPNILRQINLPAVEKLFMLMEHGVTESLRDKIMATLTPDEGLTGKEAGAMGSEASEAAKETYKNLAGNAKEVLLDAIYHDLLAGWKKQSQLVPGYSADFDRALGTHMWQVSRNASDIIYRNDIEDAYQNIQDNHPHISARQYWSHWRQYQENPQNAFSRAAGTTAQIGATYAMGMNPSTTLMIGAHTPLMATPVLGVGGGMGQATAQMLRGVREAYRYLSFDKKSGAYIDIASMGKTAREKALIAELDKAGLLHSLGADDIRALNDRQAGLWGAAAPTMKKGMDIAMSNISAVDQANRSAIALAAYRMASNPAALEKMAAPWMEHNAIFRQMVMEDGLTPENFTKFILSEAAGSWGRMNQAPAMRGAEGSLIFALHGFQTRFLSTALKLAKNMGPAGRVAAGWMMLALWAGTGVYGLPFTQDMENAAGALWKAVSGTDPMIDAHIRQFLQDAGLGKLGTEILLRGPLSVMTGVDLGSRLGFGNIITESLNAGDLIGTIPTMLWSRAQAAYDRERTGQGIGAAAAELLPSALRSPARAMIENEQGVITQSGHQVLTPDQITTGHAALRSVGLPSLGETEARDRSNYVRELQERDKSLHQKTVQAWANITERADRAQKEGDFALAHELANEASDLINSYNQAHWQTPLTQESLKNAIFEHTSPELYHISKAPGRLKGEAYRSPY